MYTTVSLMKYGGFPLECRPFAIDVGGRSQAKNKINEDRAKQKLF